MTYLFIGDMSTLAKQLSRCILMFLAGMETSQTGHGTTETSEHFISPFACKNIVGTVALEGRPSDSMLNELQATGVTDIFLIFLEMSKLPIALLLLTVFGDDDSIKLTFVEDDLEGFWTSLGGMPSIGRPLGFGEERFCDVGDATCRLQLNCVAAIFRCLTNFSFIAAKSSLTRSRTRLFLKFISNVSSKQVGHAVLYCNDLLIQREQSVNKKQLLLFY